MGNYNTAKKMKQRKDAYSVLLAEMEHMKKLLAEMHKAIQFAYNALEVNGILVFNKEEKAFQIQQIARVILKKPEPKAEVKVEESVREVHAESPQ